jgi:hypothetical protein
MLATLRSIDNNIGSFASQLVRSTDITNADVGNLNSNNGLGKSIASWGLGGVVLGSLFAKIPALGNIFGKVGTSIFGGKQSVEDSGFKMDAASLATILGNGAHAFQYADIKTSGGWLGRDKTSEQATPLSETANQQFTSIIKSLSDSVKTAGDLLGLSGDDFTNKLNSFVVDIGEVSLKGLKGDDLQKAVESVFAKLGDQMAQFAVDGLGPFQKVGEGYLETLTRIGAEYQTIDVVFQSFGKTFGEVGLSSIEARDRLVQLAGGLDKFTSQGEYFLQNFFSEQEQAAALRKRIDPTLAQFGLSSSGENASEAFRNVIVGLDTTTAAGAQAYSTLMTIAPALKSVIDAEKDTLDKRKDLQDKLDELTMTSAQLHEKERAAIDASNLALYDRVSALQAERDEMTYVLGNVDNAFSILQTVTKRTTDEISKRIEKEKALSAAIRSTIDSIDPPGAEELDRKGAQAQIQAALAIAKAGGPLPAADDLRKALSVLSKDASTQFTTYQAYLKDALTTKNALKELGGLADDSLSVDQKQLNSLNDMLDAQQRQIDILKGIDSTGLTIADALGAFQLAVAGAKSNPVVAATQAIGNAYQSSLGRVADSAGLQYWQNQSLAGTSIADIQAGIANSAEAQIQKAYQDLLGRPADARGLTYWLKSGDSVDAVKAAIMQSDEYKKHLHPLAVGTNSVPQDMPAFIHKGERIIPAADNRALMARLASPSSNNDALLAEVKALRDEVARLRESNSAENVAIAKSSAKSADALDGAVNGGRPLLTATE